MSKKSRRGLACMLVGLLLLLGAGGFWLYNEWENDQAGQAANTFMTQVHKQITDDKAKISSSGSSSEISVEKITADSPAHVGNMMGLLSIPSLQITLPIQWNYSVDALKTSPCRFTNDGTLDRLIICGHNYRTHFGKLGSLKKGDKVLFTDMDGRVCHFAVSETMTVAADDWAALKTGDWDLTLFTCTFGNQQRVLVRCKITP